MSHKSKVLAHLKKHKTITPLEALSKYGCMRLAARIQELRQSHSIITERPEPPASYAVYRLVVGESDD